MKRYRVHYWDEAGDDQMDELDATTYTSNDDGVHFLLDDGRTVSYETKEVWWIEESLL